MIIADRSLKLHQGQSDVDVAVRIFLPERNEGAWATKYEIDWPEGTRKGIAQGLDSVQSLLFALKMIGAEIYTSDYHKSGNLMWSEPGQGYGFPVSQNLRDFLQGEDAEFL
ncbi:MAG: hypothetical protein ABSD08_14680 [Xanthobacteraceae bacterium]|jgi:hypothetical protein